MSDTKQEGEIPTVGMDAAESIGTGPSSGAGDTQKLGDVWRATAKIPLPGSGQEKPSEGKMPGEGETATTGTSGTMPFRGTSTRDVRPTQKAVAGKTRHRSKRTTAMSRRTKKTKREQET